MIMCFIGEKILVANVPNLPNFFTAKVFTAKIFYYTVLNEQMFGCYTLHPSTNIHEAYISTICFNPSAG